MRLKNRVAVAPMCQYSAVDGVPTDWHLVHYGALASGGNGLIITEASAVEPDGRITAADAGIYSDSQIEPWARVTKFIRESGSVPGIQLAHAGRKASTSPMWEGGGPVAPENGGWTPVVSASALPWGEGYPATVALDQDGIERIINAFKDGARRALAAGFQLVEVHAAHGYLLHQFLSPLTNQRTDTYGGSLENRTRLVREVTAAIREVWPSDLPVFVRISCTDWTDGGWDLEQSIQLAKWLKPLGVDLMDCSTGGNVASAKMPIGPGYQVPFAEGVRKQAEIPTGAVGLITEPHQAEKILADGSADLILLARELLRDPYWPRRAAKALGAEIEAPKQYARGW